MQAASKAQTTDALDWSTAAPVAAVLGFEQLVTTQYYELRLARGATQVDYLAAFGRERLASLHERLSAASAEYEPLRCAGWSSIERLLADCAAGKSLVAQRTSMLWFEIDDFANQPVGAVPSISVCLLPHYRIHEAVVGRDTEGLRQARGALDLMAAEASATADLEQAFAELPTHARWIHLSYMLGRARRAVKLYGVMPRSELLPYLQRVGWAGDRLAVEGALGQLYPEALLGNELYVDLNLDDFRDPERCTLGLAVAQQHLQRGNDSDPSRRAILEAWRDAGLCEASKLEEASAWPGSAPKQRGPFRREIRYLDVKLVWRPSSWQAKAYVGKFERFGLF